MEYEVNKTKDYEKFKIHPLNRRISKQHLDVLVKEIKLDNQLDINPIIVDEDWQIISGQHRYFAAKKLGLPIYYIQKSMSDDYILKANQMQKRTSIHEAIDFYIKTRDSESYKLLRDLRREFEIPFGACTALLGFNLSKNCEIINGEFEITCPFEELSEYIEKYRQMKKFLDQQQFEYRNAYRSTNFLQGFRAFLDNHDIDWDEFMKKIRMYWAMLDCAQPTYAAWTRKLISVYNKRRQRGYIEADIDE